MQNQRNFKLSLNGIVGLVTIIAIFVLLFFVARGIFQLLSLLAPVLLIGALIIHYRTVVNFGKFLVNLFKRNILGGIAAVVLIVLGFPVVAGFLFGKSLLDRKILKLTQAHHQQDEFVEYEDVTGQDEARLELKSLPKDVTQSEYDDLFEEENS